MLSSHLKSAYSMRRIKMFRLHCSWFVLWPPRARRAQPSPLPWELNNTADGGRRHVACMLHGVCIHFGEGLKRGALCSVCLGYTGHHRPVIDCMLQFNDIDRPNANRQPHVCLTHHAPAFRRASSRWFETACSPLLCVPISQLFETRTPFQQREFENVGNVLRRRENGPAANIILQRKTVSKRFDWRTRQRRKRDRWRQRLGGPRQGSRVRQNTSRRCSARNERRSWRLC